MAAMVICMASAKGGSGKTVLTATFSAFLVALGKRVLMIDTDAATNGLTLMFLKEAMMQSDVALSQHRTAYGIYDDLSKRTQPELVKTPIGADLVPATYRFKNTELIPVEQFESSLAKTIQVFGEGYDYIFLDAQAGADSVAHVTMSERYSNQVVIVSEYDPLSAAGVERLKGLFREDLTYVRTWILLNKMLPDFVRSFSDFMEVAKYASPIPWDADVVRAYARRRLALDLEKGNEFTLAVVQTLRSILGDEINESLENWLRQRTAALREPIETQRLDAEREFESLIRQHSRTVRLRSWKRQMELAALAAVPLLGLWFFPRLVYIFNLLWALAVGVGTTLIVMLYITLRRLNSDSTDRDVEEARYQRQRAALEERLRRLDALKSADAMVLLKNRGSIINGDVF